MQEDWHGTVDRNERRFALAVVASYVLTVGLRVAELVELVFETRSCLFGILWREGKGEVGVEVHGDVADRVWSRWCCGRFLDQAGVR
jgi:hypothetical protein